MVSESIVSFGTSGHCWTVGHREPESAVWHFQSSTKITILGGELGALGPGPFSKPKNCRSNTTNCNFRPGFEFSNPNMTDDIPTYKFKHLSQHFPLLFIGTDGMYPIPLGCRVYPIHRGLGFNAPRGRATPSCHHHGGQSLQFRSVQILNMTQLEPASTNRPIPCSTAAITSPQK